MICCDCLKDVPQSFTFTGLLTKEKKTFQHCTTCRKKYHFIQKNYCPHCFRQQDSFEVCGDCKKWEKEGGKCKNLAFFKYDEVFAEWLERFKYQGALHLKYTFSDLLFEKFKKEKKLIVPIPMEDGKMATRGFNQTEELLLGAGVSYGLLLGKVSGEETPQSHKKKKERMSLKQVFYLKEESRTKEIILFDDVYTTGTTLKKAQECLEGHNYKVNYSFTLAR